jgi:hypothetical protein
VRHTIGKLLIFLWTSSQLEVNSQSYGPPKSWKSQLWEFQDSQLGFLGQNDIWVLVSWLGKECTIKGKVMTSPKFRPWWVLWVHVYPWWVHAPRCSNYTLTNLLFGLYRYVWVIKFLINLHNPIPKLHHAPLPRNVVNQISHPNYFSFRCFHLWAHNWIHQRARGASLPIFKLHTYKPMCHMSIFY